MDECVDLDPDDNTSSVCIERVDTCPEHWNSQVVFLDANGNARIDGDSRNAERNHAPSCGIASPTHLYEFTAPNTGMYTVSAASGAGEQPMVFPNISLRHRCYDIASESQCSSAPDRAAIAVELEAGETIYLFVSGQPDIFDFGPSEGTYQLEIHPHLPPEVDGGQIWFNPSTGAFNVEVSGVAGSEQPIGLLLDFRDENNEPVRVHNDQSVLKSGARLSMDQNQFSGTSEFSMPDIWNVSVDMMARISQIFLQVEDELGVLSDPQSIQVTPAMQVDDGEICDRLGARSYCGEDSLCMPEPTGRDPSLTCHPFTTECPDPWTPIPLHEFILGEQWLYDGDLSRDDPALVYHGKPLCAPAATGQNDVFQFIAPADGRYRFETLGGDVDTVIWARSACGIRLREFEIACNDDVVAGNALSRVELNLSANAVVYIFVDSYRISGRGPYQLRSTREDN